jgi:hypothetical protein
MPALFWNGDRRDLTPGVGNIGALRIVIENTLKDMGFIDVRRSQSEVAGAKNDVVVAIAHFQISGPSFHEVVMATGNALDSTRNTRDQVVNKLRNPIFFD